MERVDGGTEQALIYLGTNLDNTLLPYDWYRQHVLHGALENALPEDYLQLIRGVETIADPDRARRERELSIYRRV